MLTLEKSPVLLAIKASDEKNNNDFNLFALNVEKVRKKGNGKLMPSLVGSFQKL